jgi:predicted transcriptional regulator
LLAVIRDRKPQSIAELAEMTGRAAPNVVRTLGKLEAVGFVRMKTVKRCKVPTAAMRPLRIRIDPISMNARLERSYRATMYRGLSNRISASIRSDVA